MYSNAVRSTYCTSREPCRSTDWEGPDLNVQYVMQGPLRRKRQLAFFFLSQCHVEACIVYCNCDNIIRGSRNDKPIDCYYSNSFGSILWGKRLDFNKFVCVFVKRLAACLLNLSKKHFLEC